ncbi:MAG TPA: ABC transporter permease [Gammaproteobacteria bacterium]|nr:ABC transporter permease [Gammaproteobacteria bacterium]
MNIVGLLDSLGRDLRYALRGLARRPAFTSAAVLTLALGIGATTAIFSVVYSVLIKPLPYPNADELVRLKHSSAFASDAGPDPSMYLTYRNENRTFAAVGVWQEGSATLAGGGDEPERVRALRVTDGTLEALGVQPLRGRWFTEQEQGTAAEGPLPVILTHGYWQRRFGGDEAALGRPISVDSAPSQVVGIMPPGFRFLDMNPQPDVIVAVRFPAPQWTVITGNFSYNALARLKPGVTQVEAHADVERMLKIWRETWELPPVAGVTRETIAGWKLAPVIRPLKDDLVGGIAGTLWVLMGAIGAVLLVACANIANLMLVRTDARRPELSMRAALGAVPARIARELLVESLVLGAAGSVLGLALAYVGVGIVVAIGPTDLPRLQEIAVYPPVLAFTVAISLAVTLLFGSINALKHALHVGKAQNVSSRGAGVTRERSRTRDALVVIQVALALVLVVGAALMTRTFQALHDVDPGFSDPATIQTARVWIPLNVFYSDAMRATRMEHEMLDKIAAIPGVAAVGFASRLPLAGSPDYSSLMVEGQPLQPGTTPPPRRNKFVSPGYFAATGTRIIAGRDLTWSDIETGGRVALISENFARELAAEPAGALGKRVRLAADNEDERAWREVVGVVQNVHEMGLYEAAPTFVYWPAFAANMYGGPGAGTPSPAFVIRSERAGTASLLADVRQAIRLVDSSFPIGEERTMQDLHSGSLARTSFILVMLAIAGTMALVLGVVGIYGVLAYVVAQRTREIGIRAALGAEPRQLRRMFLLRGLALSGAGAVAGLVAAVALGRLMSSLLFGVAPTDIAAYAGALVVTIAAAGLASWLPARRAASIDPMETLRAE